MSSLKEIKNRIASVKSTLKITSAMKMVASAKLHKAQQAVENMRPYEAQLSGMLRSLQSRAGASGSIQRPDVRSGRVAVVAFSSNSSLCGGFNANVIKLAKAKVEELSASCEVEVHSVGRKMAEAMKRLGYVSPEDYTSLAAHGGYEGAAALAQKMIDAYTSGTYDEVYLIYNHFISTGVQKPVCERYLPVAEASVASESEGVEYILEPSASELLEELIPKVLRLGVYTVLLDSMASEHAARTVAMQTATDNGENILSELTLEYNKGRQQKITSEILDIVGGSML